MPSGLVSCVLLIWTSLSEAAEPSGALTASTALVSGPAGERWNPALRLGLRGAAKLDLGSWALGGAWAVWRDQAFCDTCGDGLYSPGNGGGSRIVDSDDLLVSLTRAWDGEVRLTARLDAVVPASRDAFACNPFYGAPGLGLSADSAAGPTHLTATASVRRPIYRYDAAPVGLCSAPLDATAHTPTPWAGERFAGSNPSLALATGVSWTDPHALIGAVERLSTAITVGAQAQRRRVADAAVVETLSGPIVVDAGHSPVVWAFPASITAAWSVSEPLDLSLTLSNAVPAVLADPGATVRNLPATTAITFAATRRL